MKQAKSILLSFLGIIFLTAAVQSGYIPPPPPHNPLIAKCTVGALVEDLNAGRAAEVVKRTKIYTDQLGLIDDRNLAAFVNDLGITKKGPFEVRSLSILRVADTIPLYVTVLQRSGVPDFKNDHVAWTVWLVSFSFDKVASLRRADELWPFTVNGEAFWQRMDCPKPPAG